ncbi:hypothetical protein AAC387_Pa08g0251 [Persea americana]
MQAPKEKVSDMASAAKERIVHHKAKVEEKVEKAASRTGEKEIAEERRKAKEEEAKMELHESKAHHKAQREHAKHEREYPHDGHERLSAMHGHHYSAATNPAPDKYL